MPTICPYCAEHAAPTASDGAIAVPACRDRYRELLSRGREDFLRMRSHPLAVDTWIAQHPHPDPGADAVRDFGVHLVSLYAQLALGAGYREVKSIRRQAGETIAFRSLPIPERRAGLDVAYVLEAGSAREHVERVRAWSRSVWQAWHPHQDQIMSWTRRIVGHGRVAEPPREALSGWYAGARNTVHPS